MLILKRRAGEAFTVNNNIEVVILSSKDGTIRVGIDAPQEVSIWRNELLPFIKSATAKKPSWVSKLRLNKESK